MTRQTTTRDLAFAIRDALDLLSGVSHLDEDGEESVDADSIMGVDISDPDNPIVEMASGAIFTIRIVRTG
jgi:hypothetical protein